MTRETIRRAERKTVTVCIAAACDMGTEDRKLILCADGLVSSGLGKTDFRLKIRPSGRWHILTAGRDDDIAATLEHMRDRIRDGDITGGTPIDDDVALLTAVRASIAQRKKERADEVVMAQYAIPYDTLLDIGKEKLPAEIYRDALLTVRDARVDAEFIIAGFERTGYPLVVETEVSGRVCIREKFATIGAGAALAQSVLLHRQYSDFDPLYRCLYAVFEAKKYAEGEISVGPSTNLMIVDKEGNCSLPTADCMKWLEEQYAEFGPKPISRDMSPPEGVKSLQELTKARQKKTVGGERGNA